MLRILLLMVVVLACPATAGAAHTLGDPEPFHLSPGDYFKVPVTGATFSDVSDVIVRLTPFGGGASTDITPVDVEADTAVGARIPTGLAVEQYTVKVLVLGVANDPTDPDLWVRVRPFRFIAKPTSYAPYPSSGDYKDTDFGDVDNDGFLDIFQSNSLGSSAIDVLLINQLGLTPHAVDFVDETATLFENTVTDLGSNDRTYDADLIDLDLDGDVDIVRIDQSNSVGIRILLNDGTGNFTDRTIDRPGIGSAILPPPGDINDVLGFSGNGVAEVDSGDVDGDGRPDLLLCNWSTTRNVLLLNRLNTTGRFEIANTDCGGADEDAFCLVNGMTNRGGAFGDFNNDGRLDIILPTLGDTDKTYVLINTGNNASGVPQFTVESDWVTGSAPSFGPQTIADNGDLKVADLDGDGDDDVAMGSPYTTNGRILWNDNGTRLVELSTSQYPIPARAYDVAFGDLDRDGDIDIIFAHFGGGGQEMVLINRGGTDANMLFDPVTAADLWYRETAFGDEPYTPTFQLSASVGDYDLDGDLDLVTGGFSEVRVWKNDLFDQPGEDRDWVFVLDRTGSMISGGKDFFEPSKVIIDAFLSQRRTGDLAALVTFDYAGTDSMNPDAADDSNKAQIESEVGAKSISDLQADVAALSIGTCGGFCTSIGWALKTGAEVASMAPDPDREKVLVLVTDGRNNQSPHPDEIISDIPSNVMLYTVALGSNTDDRMLSALATNGGKFYFAGRSTDYESVQSALRDIDNDIESHSTGKQTLFPLHTLLWSASFTQVMAKSPYLSRLRLIDDDARARVSYFVVDPADSQVRFTLNWRRSNDSNGMIVVDPKGRTYPLAGSDLVRERRSNTSHVLEVLDPLSGVWSVTEQVDPDTGPAKLTAMASSDLQLSAAPEFPLFYLGEPMAIRAELAGAPVGIQGQARVVSPSKVETIVTATPAGGQALTFRTDNLTEPGTYMVEVMVIGPPRRPFVRTWQSAVHVAAPTPNEPDLRTAELTLAPTELPADGTANATATLNIKQRDGAPLIGASVSFVARRGSMVGPVLDHGDGSYSQTLQAGTLAGTGSVQARVGSTRLPNRADFRLVTTAVDPARTVFDVLIGPLNLCSNQNGSFTVRVGPVDTMGNPIFGASVEIEEAGGSTVQWLGPVKAIGHGEVYEREFWGPDQPGVYEFSAKVDGTPLTKTITVEVFDPDSPEGQALGCVAVAGVGGGGTVAGWPGWLLWVLLLILILIIIIWWLVRK